MKRKSSDNTNYKYDMFDERDPKRGPRRWDRYGAVAGAGGASSGVTAAAYGVKNMWASASTYLPVLEEAMGAEIMADLLVPVAMGGAVAAGAVAAAAGVGYLAGTALSSMFTQEIENIQSLMPGTYQGKFALSANAAFKGLRDQYQKNGCVYIIENYGAVADPDLVYIGQSTWNDGAVINAIAGALLRKLFKKGFGLDPQTTYEVLSLSNFNVSSPGFTLRYESRGTTGTVTTKDVVIPANSSIDTLINLVDTGFSLYNAILSQLKDNGPSIFTKISVYSAPGVLQYQMDMEKEVLHVAMSSHMVIQNRTKSVTGSTSTDEINTQPLKGPVYQFAIGTPKIKAGSPIQLNQMENQGLILVRTAQFGGTDVTAYKEPPVKKLFQNVTKTGYVRLNPGALKSMTIGSDIKGYFNNVLFKMRFNTQDTQTKQCYGKSQLVCFEEELNSGSENNITLNYECQHIAGASLITTKNPNMQPGYAAAAINNLP